MAMTEFEGYEPILRRIRELEERMRTRAETIEYLESIQKITREEHPELTHMELMVMLPTYRHTAYSISALKGWQTRNRKEIKELKDIIPPYKFLRLIVTFSIETGTGHEPLYAEVTCDTVIGLDETVALDRILNAVIKLFWIMFDVQKALKDIEYLKDTSKEAKEIYDFVVKRKIYFQKYATEIYEAAMDNLLKIIIELDGIARDSEEYVTCQAIIKIGVEYYPAPEGAKPRYPDVHVLIEKGTSADRK